MEEGKNVFKLDGPIGRKKFFISFAIFMGYGSLIAIAMVMLYAFVGYNIYTRPIIIVLNLLMHSFILYSLIMIYSKRLNDITGGSLKKSLLYIVLFFIASGALQFIPFFKYVAIGINVTVFICLACIKGNLYSEDGNAQEAIEESNNSDAE